jgi:hypothetical protein
MPYSRKTQRHIRRHIVTLAGLDRANQQVTQEMAALGLWSDELADVQVWLVPVSLACYGWHTGRPGHIAIPAISFAQLGDLLTGQHMRLTDILRHEWAHALADVHPGLVECRAFARCFGGEYHDVLGAYDHDPARHLTIYASMRPCEDFAETFHFYIRHKGRLPVRRAAKPVIVRKWKFIDRIARAMAEGRVRFC